MNNLKNYDGYRFQEFMAINKIKADALISDNIFRNLLFSVEYARLDSNETINKNKSCFIFYEPLSIYTNFIFQIIGKNPKIDLIHKEIKKQLLSNYFSKGSYRDSVYTLLKYIFPNYTESFLHILDFIRDNECYYSYIENIDNFINLLLTHTKNTLRSINLKDANLDVSKYFCFTEGSEDSLIEVADKKLSDIKNAYYNNDKKLQVPVISFTFFGVLFKVYNKENFKQFLSQSFAQGVRNFIDETMGEE